MNWEQFRKIVEVRMKERGIPLDVQIRFIVVGAPGEDCISVQEHDGLSVSTEHDWECGVGTITWEQFGGIVEKRMQKQDIPPDAHLWFIDVLGPHTETRIVVEFEPDGLWISNI